MIRRICLYSGPSVGKTTCAAGIFYELKKQNINIEYVNEFIKTWTYLKRIPKSFDQLYCLSKQIHTEDTYLNNQVDYIVTDSPVLLNAAYSRYYGCSFADQCEEVAIQFENKFPGLHILLTREFLPYDQKGRFQNENQAKDMDNNIKNLLDKYLKYTTIPSVNFQEILDTVLRNINA